MFNVFSYATLFFVAFVMLFLVDQDNNHVTYGEWALYGLMLIAAYRMFRILIKMHEDDG